MFNLAFRGAKEGWREVGLSASQDELDRIEENGCEDNFIGLRTDPPLFFEFEGIDSWKAVHDEVYYFQFDVIFLQVSLVASIN